VTFFYLNLLQIVLNAGMFGAGAAYRLPWIWINATCVLAGLWVHISSIGIVEVEEGGDDGDA
jgi:hypothetical protein